MPEPSRSRRRQACLRRARSSRQFPRRHGGEKRGGERTCRSAEILPRRGERVRRAARRPRAEANADGRRRRQRRRVSTTTPASRASTARSTPSPRKPGPAQHDGKRPRQAARLRRRSSRRASPPLRWFAAGGARRQAPQAAKRRNARQRFRRTRASSGRASGLPPPKTMGSFEAINRSGSGKRNRKR